MFNLNFSPWLKYILNIVSLSHYFICNGISKESQKFSAQRSILIYKKTDFNKISKFSLKIFDIIILQK